MVKKIISIEKPEQKKPIKEKIELPTKIEEGREAKISIDSRKQFFVRFPSVVAEVAQITTKDKVGFKVIAPIHSKDKKEIRIEMQLIRG